LCPWICSFNHFCWGVTSAIVGRKPNAASQSAEEKGPLQK
jgi:hypothetical protein